MTQYSSSRLKSEFMPERERVTRNMKTLSIYIESLRILLENIKSFAFDALTLHVVQVLHPCKLFFNRNVIIPYLCLFRYTIE
jgi:hypothetical protein